MTDGMAIHQYVVGMVATNCYIVENTKTKEAFVVDPGDGADMLLAQLKEKGLTPVAILLTHGHFDHAGAAEELSKKAAGAVAGVSGPVPIYAYDGERQTMEQPSLNLSAMMGGGAQTYHGDVWLRDEQTIQAAGFSIRVLAVPGHTPGGCCYYIPREDVVFSGDTLFCGSVGRSDFPGGSTSALIGGIRSKLMTLPEDTLVCPGHDERTTIEQERMYNPFL